MTLTRGNLSDFDAHDAVEDGLRSLPVIDPPPDLYASIMKQVEAHPRVEVERPRFRVTWLDFAISLFFAGMIGVALLIPALLPVSVRMTLDWQLGLLQAARLDRLIAAALLMSLLICAGAAALFAGQRSGWKTGSGGGEGPGENL